MKWPLKSKPAAEQATPFFNLLYLSASGSGGPDSTIVWTSEVCWEPVVDFVTRFNQENNRLIASAHLLVQAVGKAMADHPEVNRRVVGRRIYEFKECNVCVANRVPQSNEVKVIQIRNVDQKSLKQIAHVFWKKQLEFMRCESAECRDLKRMRRIPEWMLRMAIGCWGFLDRWIRIPIWGRIDRLRESAVLINDFSHPRFPPMRGYKPSRQPGESKPLNVTLGRAEERVVMKDGRPAVERFAPLTVRVDHRICDGFELGQFTRTIINYLQNPEKLKPSIETNPVVESNHSPTLQKSA